MFDDALSFTSKGAILIVAPEKSRAIVDTFVAKEYTVISLNGAEIKSKEELFRYLSQAMKFPKYFGSNWDALEECLNDLSWLPAKGYVLRFANANNFINNCSSDFRMFVQIIESVSITWSIDKVDFILIVEIDNPQS